MHGYLKDLLNTKNDLALYNSHMVVNLEGELDFYFTTKQQCFPFRKEAHDILQST